MTDLAAAAVKWWHLKLSVKRKIIIEPIGLQESRLQLAQETGRSDPVRGWFEGEWRRRTGLTFVCRKRGVSVNSCWGLSHSFIACQLFHQQLSRDFLILYQMWGDSPLAEAGTVMVWPWWCQPWSAAKLHLRLLQGPDSWVIQNAPQQGPSSISLLPSVEVKIKLLSQNSGKGCKSASRWKVWVESRDFLKLWLNSEVCWSAAGEGNAAGSPTCPFVPPQVWFAMELWAGAVCGARTAILVTRPSEQA